MVILISVIMVQKYGNFKQSKKLFQQIALLFQSLRTFFMRIIVVFLSKSVF